MPPNANEYKSVVGIDQVYVAAVLEDDADAYVTDTPEYLAPVATVTSKPKTSQDTQYADNTAIDVASAEAETDIEVDITNLPAEMYAKLLGSHFDVATGTVDDVAATPGWFALGFRSMKSNGKYRYYWFHKCQFSTPDETAQTKADNATPQVVKLACKALKTFHQFTVDGETKGIKRKFGDEDTTNFDSDGWFEQVQVPGSTVPSALALSSSVPAANATGVSKTNSQTLTFNNPLAADAIHGVTLLDATPALVTITPTLDTTKKIITIAHSALAGTTAHTLVYAVTDVYGQTLNGILKFTTAA